MADIEKQGECGECELGFEDEVTGNILQCTLKRSKRCKEVNGRWHLPCFFDLNKKWCKHCARDKNKRNGSRFSEKNAVPQYMKDGIIVYYDQVNDAWCTDKKRKCFRKKALPKSICFHPRIHLVNEKTVFSYLFYSEAYKK